MAPGPNKKQRSKVVTQKRALRDSLWPTVSHDDLWDYRKSDGWLNVPRALPIILRIMDNMSKGKPVSAVYLDLWCRTFDDSFVIANKPREMAFFSGYGGERAERTWAARIRLLQEMGLIDVKGGPNGPISYILLFNPYQVLQKAHSAGRIDQSSWNALMEKIIEIRAKDLDLKGSGNAVADDMMDEEPEAALVPPPASPQNPASTGS